jgi:hypothetical protein
MSGQSAVQTQTVTKPAITPVASSVLQRQCACGQHTSAGGECEECKKKREGTLQRAAISPSRVNEVPPIVHEVLRSPGLPLDAPTRAFMEPRFGHDFSGVRVHTDKRATESARAVNALAYTVGSDLVFEQGYYAPHTAQGRRLLAHELTHTIQQSRSAAQLSTFSALDQVAPVDSPAEREAEHSAAAVMSEAQLRVRSGSAVPQVARVHSDTRTLHEATREIDVTRIVTAGRCTRVPVTRTHATAGIDQARGFFEATACRGGTEGSVSGELDFSEIISGFGNFVSGIPGAASSGPQGLEDLASRTVGSAPARAQVRFVLRLNSFRAELGGSASASATGGVQSAQVDALLRYSNGRFRIELIGQHQELLDVLNRGQDTNLTFGTDIGPVEVRLRGSRTARGAGAGQSQDYVFDGEVRYRLGGEAIGAAVSVEHSLPPNGSPSTQVIFSLRVTTGGEIPQVRAPDCTTCHCENPRIEYVCSERRSRRQTERPSAPQPVTVPLYFEYARTDPRHDWVREYRNMLNEIISYIRQGYTIARIDGFTSPEGPLGRHPSGRFEGNILLAQERADKARDDVREALRQALQLQISNETTNQRFRTALASGFPVAGQAESFGSRPSQPDIPEGQLYSHLTTTLAAPPAGHADPLVEARVIGSSLPESVRASAEADIRAFRTGQRATSTGATATLSRDQRLQALYRNLRRSLVTLNPPSDLMRMRSPETSQGFLPFAPSLFPTYRDLFGDQIPCTDAHKAVFNGVPIPPDAMFDDQCSTGRRRGGSGGASR